MIFIYIFSVGTILFTLNTFILIVIIVENSYADFFIDFEAFTGHRSDNIIKYRR
ncbi:hypothetical protein ECEC1845_1312 [Escherichia coli EC1845]|nr:hypothetical protein ECDEC3A_1213 [Escherichia coli DEC3A]EHU80131.1 hypothetical protein ECDEC3D_1420 [Escherichia coli DEC3D]EHU93448.1 hypothetical protein ECDEC3F_1503 [Escherichia coli DEC3F]EHU95989.1 hypothetical protein ECDEC4A_1134 [Escherichia coli DEC4A]EHV11972.1 hypothetical protein ECDEC4C_1120 [Escherichia coli DEC4C]EHV34603.1 hypothetical protein ECDEC5B_1424 [Escherichia coli DEC5B]EIN47329.1 hypothetical protein ECFRIK1985_1387 [Escherichia coli FRIK1985]EIN91551.1 hypo